MGLQFEKNKDMFFFVVYNFDTWIQTLVKCPRDFLIVNDRSVLDCKKKYDNSNHIEIYRGLWLWK